MRLEIKKKHRKKELPYFLRKNATIAATTATTFTIAPHRNTSFAIIYACVLARINIPPKKRINDHIFRLFILHSSMPYLKIHRNSGIENKKQHSHILNVNLTHFFGNLDLLGHHK